MLRTLLGGVTRILICVAMAVATVFPDAGVIAMGTHYLPAAPLAVTTVWLVWAMLLSLFLPLPLRWFRIASTSAVVGVEAVAAYKLLQVAPGFLEGQLWMVWAAAAIALPLGWLKVTAPLWRWASGVVAVQDDSPTH